LNNSPGAVPATKRGNMSKFSMAIWLIAFGAALICGCGGGERSVASPSKEEINWVGTNHISADTTLGRDLSFIYFYVDGHYWCNRFINETLGNAKVIAALNKNFNSIRINVNVDSNLVIFDSCMSCAGFTSAFEIDEYPSCRFIDREGNVVGRIRGYIGANSFIDTLETVIDRES
jgi:thioredoxin-related protein